MWCPGAELNHRHRDFQSDFQLARSVTYGPRQCLTGHRRAGCRALPVPTGPSEAGNFNDLVKGWGENCPIDFQGVSELGPKPLAHPGPMQAGNDVARLRGPAEGRPDDDALMVNRLLTGWSLVRIRPGEPLFSKG